MNNGQFGKKKRIQVAYLGFMHIWVLAFGNKYYLRVCYDPQFIVTERLWNFFMYLGLIRRPVATELLQSLPRDCGMLCPFR